MNKHRKLKNEAGRWPGLSGGLSVRHGHVGLCSATKTEPIGELGSSTSGGAPEDSENAKLAAPLPPWGELKIPDTKSVYARLF